MTTPLSARHLEDPQSTVSMQALFQLYPLAPVHSLVHTRLATGRPCQKRLNALLNGPYWSHMQPIHVGASCAGVCIEP